MKQLRAGFSAIWRRLRPANDLEAAMHQEMRFHIEMETERLVQEGLDPQDARRQAHVRFGGLEKYKEAGRDARGGRWIDAIALDTRLAARMLVKYRGLTLIGGFAMAVAIAIGATSFAIINQVLTPALPLEDGARIVSLQAADLQRDFAALRGEITVVEQLSAFRTVPHNLVSGSALPEPVRVAEMTASGFVVARTPPQAGRYLLEGDERQGAAPVVVIGHQAWQARFGGDPQIVGRTIVLGGSPSTVVGVMPDGFRFPIDHQFWIPLRPGSRQARGSTEPGLELFGRLKPGVTIEEAEAELTTIAQRTVVPNQSSDRRPRPMVSPYARAHLDVSDPGVVWLLQAAKLFIGALSFVVAVNLAILVYARTVTRVGEIAVRSALGASRRRILVQLFIESLALTVVGAALGLVLADLALRRLQMLSPAIGSVPFWINFDLSIGTAIYALGLAALAAVIMGVLPGLKATGRGLIVNLHELHGRTGAATRLGPFWTTLVVTQVAVAVAVLPAAVYLAWQVGQLELAGPGFAAEKFVLGRVALGDETAVVDSSRTRRWQLDLMSRLEAEPGVAAVTFSSHVPGLTGGRRIHFDDPSLLRTGTDRPLPQGVGTLAVSVNMFDVYAAELVAGRGFTASDLGAAYSVVVNRTFVETFLGNRSPLGLRFRYSRDELQQPELYQVVGVVRDFPSFPPALALDDQAVVYHPAAAGDIHHPVLSVRFEGSIPAGFAERFRAMGAEVDPALQLQVVPLPTFYDNMRSLWRYVAWAVGLITLSVLLLSAAGIYALMSFTIAQRTREIGIRLALGAPARGLLINIFGRVLRQLALGVLVGSLVATVAFSAIGFGFDAAVPVLLAVAAIMLVVGLAAGFGPARRSLRVQAMEALRSDG